MVQPLPMASITMLLLKLCVGQSSLRASGIHAVNLRITKTTRKHNSSIHKFIFSGTPQVRGVLKNPIKHQHSPGKRLIEQGDPVQWYLWPLALHQRTQWESLKINSGRNNSTKSCKQENNRTQLFLHHESFFRSSFDPTRKSPKNLLNYSRKNIHNLLKPIQSMLLTIRHSIAFHATKILMLVIK